MTRIKKTRKLGSLGPRKADKRPEKSTAETRKHERKGLKSGTRNGQLEAKKPVDTQTGSTKDPKIGSKKPIDLFGQTPEQTNKIDAPMQPQAKLNKQKKVVEPTQAWQQELAQLENDQNLQSLLDRYDNNDKLTAAELAELNKKMARHAWLMEKLGLDEIEMDEDEALFDEWEKTDFKNDDY
ncbi:Der GTPase-activating protein YihI [Catenovulum sp. 2E275]|uniref:Der GTPase-activating protein YihI n=1 Tax=Catenovulum sp. 2E275 TaxID=2980497 RepID=UPI0021D310BA|nr:Der GTPase-activating protein YihI [Catenovulum sp. 2E275]MCU4675866.1 Der GTPase-activating protein YihI [Catenovulum sp. 2E275]